MKVETLEGVWTEVDYRDEKPCSYCGAARKESCRTRSGAVRRKSHAARLLWRLSVRNVT